MAVNLQDDQGKVKATVLALKTLSCGFCRTPINRGSGPFYAVADPYFCLVHSRCMPLFEFDGQDRNTADYHKQQEVRYNEDKTVLSKFMGCKTFATRVPQTVREAWRRSFGQLLALLAWRKEVLDEEDTQLETTTQPSPPIPASTQSDST